MTMIEGELLLLFDAEVEPSDLSRWIRHLDSTGIAATRHRLGAAPLIAADSCTLPPFSVDLPAPIGVVRAGGAFQLGRRELRPAGTVVPIGPTIIGDGSIAVFAGPCAVENREQLLDTAEAVREHGAVGLRGGAFKPRTSPYSFQGTRWAGLDLLAEARTRTGLPILTEVVEPGHVERVAEVADGLQIGARNMQNFALLTEVGRTRRPVVLKRGFGATVEELLGAAEYILAEGNDQVVLCERGIRTFEPATRFTLDLSAVALLKQRTHLPVMVDPSHAVGIRELIGPVTLAAAAVGADALLIDVHVRPEEALCDGKQALRPDEFGRLMSRLETLAMGVRRTLADAPAATEVLVSESA
jgi:3-deoxy-7-phosphoheptulonate synthase